MQKQILFTCTLLVTSSSAMEKLLPRIVYHKNSVHNSLVEQLSQKFNILSIHATEKELDNTSTIIHATQCIIPPHNQKRKPNYIISLAEGNSFIGQHESNNINMYAPIPMAAAYALERELVKRILIIDENITLNTIDYYFDHGNGSIFFPENNPKLAALFNNKIVTHNQVSEELWDFLHNQKNRIDLAFYNINIDDVEPIEDLSPADAKERTSRIISLLYNFIPTVFIFSGDKKTHQAGLCSHIDYINEQAQKCVSFKNEPFPMPHLQATMSCSRSLLVSSDEIKQEWQQCKDNFIHATCDPMSWVEKHPASIATTAIAHNYQSIPTQSPSPSRSLSSSLSDFAQKMFDMYASPSDEEEFFDDYNDRSWSNSENIEDLSDVQ